MLPDLLAPSLRVVFCGTAAGTASAAKGAYYAGRGNQFWTTLFAVGLTPRLLQPSQFRSLLEYGIGLTDLVKVKAGMDQTLAKGDFATDAFMATVQCAAPRCLAFNGKKAATVVLGTTAIAYGRQECRPFGTTCFVLPSTSAAAKWCWNVGPWRELASFVAAKEADG